MVNIGALVAATTASRVAQIAAINMATEQDNERKRKEREDELKRKREAEKDDERD